MLSSQHQCLLLLALVLLILDSTFGFQGGRVSVLPSPPAAHQPQHQPPYHRHRRQSYTAQLRMGAAQSSDLPDSTKQEYQNKSILITGASRGLGRSLAKSLSSCNPSLLVLSGRDEVALSEVKEECLQIDNGEMKVEIVVCNLADKSSVDKLATSALQLSRRHTNSPIDILINNGGISSRSSFLQTKLESTSSPVLLWQRVWYQGMAAKKRGKIVWISSVQGKLGTPYRTSYAASKFAVQGYCEALRSELSSNNISVHIASPGYIRTNLSVSAVMGDGKAYSKMDDTTANGADPDDVACTILNSVAKGESDFVVAATFAAKAALWLKFLLPSLLESKLVKRFEKGEVEAKKTE
ncbi:predicted protein [Thalassiosira pseudonana CCMP1335]|uniref:Ketoreductase domain-containing protein n=1 Tax=Thalassiosira pseudonana TaxID=35128 RepID=B8BX30_THAPS|nr:predicted protein [Thalassiosira pseudonana CCMP1335]EED93636.1 predicted protein [Thalassiosira pseudonana CCMP1335]